MSAGSETGIATEPKIVVVTGDATLDWNVACTRPAGDTFPSTDDRAEAFCQPGGAALVGELIEKVAAGLPAVSVRRVVPDASSSPGLAGFHHSYASWAPYEGKNRPRWLVESFLGLDRQSPGENPRLHELAEEPGADLVVIDDAGLGFRDDSELWPSALSMGDASRDPWVLLKMAKPVAQGHLWDMLLNRCADRLVVLIASNDLRLMDVQISRGLSWERTAEDLLWALVNDPRLQALSGCAHVVVSFQTTGALLLSGREECRLLFDRRLMEDTWSEEHPGQLIGYTSCLAASLARQLLLDPAQPNLPLAIQNGVAAMRALHASGYDGDDASTGRRRLAFPVDRVAAEIAEDDRDPPLATTPVREPAHFLLVPESRSGSSRQPSSWRILEDLANKLEEVAEEVVFKGLDAALADVPVATFGDLMTVDRLEIEAFRSIRTLILEYSHARHPKRPLSIAVFGPPGAGKSFGVEEVAKSITGRIETLKFNLSQLNDASGLHGALHQVRDHALAGKLPLVFWDEFDSSLGGEDLGWLRHFLVPMQDGTFQEGELTHAVGPAIFVFAGGTRHRMSEFASESGPDFRKAKGPDFVSRLKGYIDILGPDPIDGNTAADPYYIVRRAILLRSILIRGYREQLFRPPDPKGVLDIDSGVLRGLLQTQTYQHGARSLESIVQMSRLHGERRFSRSALPAKTQLELHVEGREFLALVHALELGDERRVERLAEAMHVLYCRGMLRDGFDWGGSPEYLRRHERLSEFAGREEAKKTHPTLVDWDLLEPHDHDQNRDLVRRIPLKLVRTGYVTEAARPGDPPGRFTDEDVELLAEEEHERWMWLKLRRGWHYGAQGDKAKLEHAAMLPWRRLSRAEKIERYGSYADQVGDYGLPDVEKEKDRDLIRGIPEALRDEGYTIVKAAAEPDLQP